MLLNLLDNAIKYTRRAGRSASGSGETARAGILETGRTFFQVISFLPLLLVLASRRAGQFRLLSASLLLAYAAMSVLTLGTIRYRFPLIRVELLSIVFIIDISARRFCAGVHRKRQGAHI
jgi:hypothetical protein